MYVRFLYKYLILPFCSIRIIHFTDVKIIDLLKRRYQWHNALSIGVSTLLINVCCCCISCVNWSIICFSIKLSVFWQEIDIRLITSCLRHLPVKTITFQSCARSSPLSVTFHDSDQHWRSEFVIQSSQLFSVNPFDLWVMQVSLTDLYWTCL